MNDQTSTLEVTEAKTIIRPNLHNYVAAKSGNGKRTHRIDDLTARTLDGKTIEEVVKGAKALGIDAGKWEHLNNGQQRMLIGNAIRKQLSATKDPLTETGLAAVFGEPAAPYDADAAAAAAEKVKADREAKKAEKEAAAAKKAEENAAKAAAKREAAEQKAESADATEQKAESADATEQKAKKTKPAKPE